jgi:hypothetical protein
MVTLIAFAAEALGAIFPSAEIGFGPSKAKAAASAIVDINEIVICNAW